MPSMVSSILHRLSKYLLILISVLRMGAQAQFLVLRRGGQATALSFLPLLREPVSL